jgi:hypothetical protein
MNSSGIVQKLREFGGHNTNFGWNGDDGMSYLLTRGLSASLAGAQASGE